MLSSTDLPWILPFGLFLALLGVLPMLDLAPRWAEAIRWLVVGGAVALVSRPVLDFRVTHWVGSIGLGVLVFAVWILPDLLFEGWRDHALFSNGIVGRPESSFAEAGRDDPVALALRFSRAALLVPIVEELFWRGWLPRWAIAPGQVEKVPLGSYTPWVFWVTAILFASEHGSFWEVGLLAGVAYNWWMQRTRSLGDLILAHGITNACLSAYVLATGKWVYW
jgi:hypothetical protein